MPAKKYPWISREHDEMDLFHSRFKSEDAGTGFKRTTSFDNFNEITYSKQSDQALKKGNGFS